MSDLFLDLKDKPRVIDFLVEAVPFMASSDERGEVEVLVKQYQDGERVPTDKLADVARRVAISTWPSRYALKRFLSHEGVEEEWKKVLAAVRPSTAHLLKRTRQATKAGSLDELLKHPEATPALRDEETEEIGRTRVHVREDIWKSKKDELSRLVNDGQRECDGYVKRLRGLRDLAEALPQSLQEEVFSKLRHYEDRIMFAGEIVPMEILDEEIRYYTDQKEISPLEE